jgi:hypothetical protein
VRPAPLATIATLKFTGGVIAGPSGPEELEQVAILDLDTNTVIAIEPHRQGKKVAEWTWQDDRVVVASVDGANDEFVLRTVRPREVARRDTSGGAWSPFGQFGDDRPSRRRGGGKSIFQLLFGN